MESYGLGGGEYSGGCGAEGTLSGRTLSHCFGSSSGTSYSCPKSTRCTSIVPSASTTIRSTSARKVLRRYAQFRDVHFGEVASPAFFLNLHARRYCRHTVQLGSPSPSSSPRIYIYPG